MAFSRIALYPKRMELFDWIKLFFLGAIWGGSFTLLRIVVPSLGTLPTACLRILISGSLLTLFFILTKTKVEFKKFCKPYFAIGLLHSAIPLSLFAAAATTLPAGVLVILNGTGALFSVALGILLGDEKFTKLRLMGFFLGFLGIIVISNKNGSNSLSYDSATGIIYGLFAAFSYALGSQYLKKIHSYNPAVMTGISQLIGAVLLLPFVSIYLQSKPVDTKSLTFPIVGSILGLALICSGLAFLVFYKLIAKIGSSKAMTVGYIMPIFGVIFGFLFLNEPVTAQLAGGSCLILLGVRFSNS